jgi:chemotaxis signal transduction protein
MLSILVDQHPFTLPHQAVVSIEALSTITALPFLSMPYEGLIHYRCRALLLINLAAHLGLTSLPKPTDKLLILTTAQGAFAVRVTAVVHLDARSPHEYHPTEQQLSLAELCPADYPFTPPIDVTRNISHQPKPTKSVPVLVVRSGEYTLALINQSITQLLDMTNTATALNAAGDELMVGITNQLLTCQSLATLLNCTPSVPEAKVLIISTQPQPWALRVEKIIGLDTLTEAYLHDASTNNNWCLKPAEEILARLPTTPAKAGHPQPVAQSFYLTQTGEQRVISHPKQLLSPDFSLPKVRLNALEHAPNRTLTPAVTPSQNLHVHIGSAHYQLLPTLATQLLPHAALLALRTTRVNSSPSAFMIPVIDTRAWFFGQQSTTIKHLLLLTLAPRQQLVIAMDDANLANASHSLTLSCSLPLPHPLSLCFNQGDYDANSQQWLLKVDAQIDVNAFPWSLKKAFANALLGWLEYPFT